MDKYEYKVRSEEIKSLIAEGAYAEAAEIADTIDWHRVKSVMMLCTISDLYKVNRRYEDAKNMLLLAYEKKPGGRTICYSLCELCIKTGEFVQALNYYNEFLRVAPMDPERYILQYKIYEVQNVNLEERIGVLEELKKRDYREKWAYELAYLYHRVGLATRCVEECDELILWFGKGKYVIKAMELKMLHQPLTFDQQEIYDHRFDTYETEEARQHTEGQEDGYGDSQGEAFSYEGHENGGQEPYREGQGGEPQPEEMDIQVKTLDMGQYNTINLQEELAAGLQEVLGAKGNGHHEGDVYQEFGDGNPDDGETERTEVFFGETGEMEEAQLAEEELPYDLQEEQAEDGQRMGFPSAEWDAAVDRTKPRWDVGMTQDLLFEMVEDAVARESVFIRQEPVKGRKTAFSGSAAQDSASAFGRESAAFGERAAVTAESVVFEREAAVHSGAEPIEASESDASASQATAFQGVENASEDTASIVKDQMWEEAKAENAQPPKELADVLRQETDGQIQIVMPERTAVERQITGQMNIEDILAEWERMKKESEEKRKEEVRQRVLRQTGPMFTEFEAAIRDGLLGQLDRAEKEDAAATSARRTVVKTKTTSESDDTDRGSLDRSLKAELAADAGSGSISENLETAGLVADVEPGSVAGYPEAADYTEETEDWNPDEKQELPEYEEWVEGQEDAGYAKEQEPEWADGQEPLNGIEDPEYVEEEAWSDNPDVFLETEAAEYLDEEAWSEGEDVFSEEEGTEYAEDEVLEPWVEGEGTSDVIEETPYEEDTEFPEFQEFQETVNLEEEEGERSEALDYLEALEHVEEAELLENKESEVWLAETDSRADEENLKEKPEAALKKEGTAHKNKPEKAAGESEGIPEQDKPGRLLENRGRLAAERDRAKVRSMTREEKELFAPFIQSRQSREQLVKALDSISMAAYTGNVVITGEEGMDTMTLAKNIIREVRMTDSNFLGKVAKITGVGLNQKNVRKTLEDLNNGALIVQKASGMDTKTAGMLHVALQQEKFGIIVILEDTRKAIQKLFLGTPQLFGDFTCRVELEALSNDTLVSFGKRYAREKEYSIDDLGMLALHTRIEESQTIDHVVTVIEVKQIVDEAIRHASRKTLGHFFDILLARRYDDEDMIILTEKDFVA